MHVVYGDAREKIFRDEASVRKERILTRDLHLRMGQGVWVLHLCREAPAVARVSRNKEFEVGPHIFLQAHPK